MIPITKMLLLSKYFINIPIPKMGYLLKITLTVLSFCKFFCLQLEGECKIEI
jgi:hypothetical protein